MQVDRLGEMEIEAGGARLDAVLGGGLAGGIAAPALSGHVAQEDRDVEAGWVANARRLHVEPLPRS
jgi:hypothetical protein